MYALDVGIVGRGFVSGVGLVENGRVLSFGGKLENRRVPSRTGLPLRGVPDSL